MTCNPFGKLKFYTCYSTQIALKTPRARIFINLIPHRRAQGGFRSSIFPHTKLPRLLLIRPNTEYYKMSELLDFIPDLIDPIEFEPCLKYLWMLRVPKKWSIHLCMSCVWFRIAWLAVRFSEKWSIHLCMSCVWLGILWLEFRFSKEWSIHLRMSGIWFRILWSEFRFSKKWSIHLWMSCVCFRNMRLECRVPKKMENSLMYVLCLI